MERYDAASIGEMVRVTARLCELPSTALYGGGRHWFAPEVDEDGEEDEELPAGELWLQHSIALLKIARSMCTNVAKILLSGTNDRATRMQEEIEKMSGAGSYIAKFVQGDCHIIVENMNAKRPNSASRLSLTDSVAVGPGPVKYFEKFPAEVSRSTAGLEQLSQGERMILK